MKHIDELGKKTKNSLYFPTKKTTQMFYFQDDLVIQKVGLLTVNLLLNTHQAKKAEALIELLQARLNISLEQLTSDEDDDATITLGSQIKEKSCKSLDQFKWMFRLYKIRSNVLNCRNILIPAEDVRVSEATLLEV